MRTVSLGRLDVFNTINVDKRVLYIAFPIRVFPQNDTILPNNLALPICPSLQDDLPNYVACHLVILKVIFLHSFHSRDLRLPSFSDIHD